MRSGTAIPSKYGQLTAKSGIGRYNTYSKQNKSVHKLSFWDRRGGGGGGRETLITDVTNTQQQVIHCHLTAGIQTTSA